LTLKIIDLLFGKNSSQNQTNDIELKGEIENISMDFPYMINDYRNKNCHFSIDKALNILERNSFLSRQYDYTETISTGCVCQSIEGEREMVQALENMVSNLKIFAAHQLFSRLQMYQAFLKKISFS
jgi:hypothetical protein